MVNFPSSLDSLTNPSSTDDLDTTGVFHDVQHDDLNDIVEALEAKVGVDGSAVTTSHDYQLSHLPVLAVYSAYGTSDAAHNPTETSDTQVDDLTITIDAVYAGKTALVSYAVAWNASHGNRFRLFIDSTEKFPLNSGGHEGVTNDSSGWFTSAAGIVVPIPDDASSHTLTLKYQAESSTATTTFKGRNLVALII